MKIIGITGTIGAGKGAVVDYLLQKGFTHYCARTLLSEELQKRNLPLIRDNFAVVANELRQAHGTGYIIETLISRAAQNNHHAIVESIRTLGEIDVLKKAEGILLAVDADIAIRYERIVGRGHSTDHVSFEKFVEDEKKESIGKEAWQQNLPACIERADTIIFNNDSLEHLHRQIDHVIETLEI